MFAERLKKIEVSPIKQIEILASKISGVVSLAQGIPSFDTPQSIKDQAAAALKKGLVAQYSLTTGLPQLRELIENQLYKDGMSYDFETEIIITCGAIEAIAATFLAILDKGDEVILPSPSYASYQQVIRVAGGTPIFIDLIEDKGWALDIRSIEQKICSRTKAILICNPNNPTGTIYPKEQLLSLAELAQENNLYIIIDDVYKDFIYSNDRYFCLATLSKFRKNIIRVFSFSKAYSMTGWRIGFLHSDANNIAEILKVHDSLVTCAPVISQYAAMGALEWAGKDIEFFKSEYRKRRDLICSRLDKLSKIFQYQKPNSAYFVFPKILIKNQGSWQFCLDLLNRVKVATVPGIAFGPNGEGHLRMSFGRSEDVINEAFVRIEKYFKV